MTYHLITGQTAKMPLRPVIAGCKTRLVICLPLPPKPLSPNARVHWAAKAKAAKDYRTRAAFFAKNAIVLYHVDAPWPIAEIAPKFFFDTNRRRDRDNLAASLKAARDGIADAGLVANDTDIRNIDPEIIVDKTTYPRVELWITRKDD